MRSIGGEDEDHGGDEVPGQRRIRDKPAQQLLICRSRGTGAALMTKPASVSPSGAAQRS